MYEEVLKFLDGDFLAMITAAVALVVSFYAAVNARRSARAAEDSAKFAAEAVRLEHDHQREAWVEKISSALPDGEAVGGLIADLPSNLKPKWRELLDSAAKRNQRTPPKRLKALLDKHGDAWTDCGGEFQLEKVD